MTNAKGGPSVGYASVNTRMLLVWQEQLGGCVAGRVMVWAVCGPACVAAWRAWPPLCP
jgi:hypothetical protein